MSFKVPVLSPTAQRLNFNVIASLRRLTRPVDWARTFPWIREPRPLLIGAAVVLVVMLAGMALIDPGATRFARTLPRWIVDFFNFLTDFGKGAWVLWPLGLTFVAMAALPRAITPIAQAVQAALMVRVGFLFVAVALPGLFSSIVKNMIGRARPGVPGRIDPFVFDPFHWAPAWASMPSGHATTAFAVLAAVGTLWPRWRTVALLYALVIAISRIVVQAHFFTDTLLGAVVGIGGVILIRRWFAAQRLGFSITADGRVHQFPGPSVRRIKAVARELLA
ncbi:MAG: phosphatase PAP2 family protein [Pseudolabrys sp.]|jgi:undecaprenyl-diphosphatase|nr:phosphatase PAP2 family protein [Pseudolabrys sp.]